MKQTTKRFTSMILGLALVCGAFLVYFELIQPEYDELQTVRAEYIARKEVAERQQTAVDTVKRLISAYSSQGGLQGSISNSLPVGADSAGMLAQLNVLVNQSGLEAKSYTVNVGGAAGESKTPLVRPTAPLNVQIQIKGTYNSLKAFMRLLETNVRLFDVKSISIRPAQKAEVDLYDAEISVDTYYQVSADALSLPALSLPPNG